MTEPLTLSFDVACSVEHAFTTWTTRIATWWPSDHTVSGGEVVLEAGPGGRIFERSTDGTERDWGRITVWEPPSMLGYSWHLGRAAEHATEVEIRFVPGEAPRLASRSSTAAGKHLVRPQACGETATRSAGAA